MRTLTSIFSILALTLAIGCSDDDDGGGGDVDAGATVDAMAPAPDATAVPTVADGLACTVSEADPLGGCPATHICVNSKCAESCPLVPGMPAGSMAPDGMECTTYTGPGFSLCAVSITAEPGPNAPVVAAACFIICEDATNVIPGCANGVCDGTCPNTLTCQQHPNPMAPQGLKACQ